MPNTPATILLVDDEAPLLNLMETYLSRLGYTVEKRERATDALKLVREDPAKFHLVIADLTMPEMSGDKLSLEMAALNPTLRVLLCSGYPFELATLPAHVQPRFAVLQKPFLPKMLASAVEELLSRKLTPA
jgi:DNA-binding NtrC family response regulator